jgi:hypothetical protein
MSDDAVLKVPERLRDPHPLVAEAIRRSKHDRTDPAGGPPGWQNDFLCLAVSPKTFPRAARLADALFKHLERSGYSIALRRDHHDGVTVTIDAQGINIRISEVLEGRSVQGPYGESREYHPTGRLELLIEEWLEGTRKRWTDGKRRGEVEDQLASFVNGLKVAAEAKRRLTEEREIEQRRWEEEKRRRQEDAAQRLRDTQRAEELEGEALRWQRSRLIRDYLGALEEAALRIRGSLEPTSELALWIQWGRTYANRLDPLRSDTVAAPPAASASDSGSEIANE